MGLRRIGVLIIVLITVLVMTLALGQLAKAQSPTYGVGRTPTAEEIRAWDISIGPDGRNFRRDTEPPSKARRST